MLAAADKVFAAVVDVKTTDHGQQLGCVIRGPRGRLNLLLPFPIEVISQPMCT